MEREVGRWMDVSRHMGERVEGRVGAASTKERPLPAGERKAWLACLQGPSASLV